MTTTFFFDFRTVLWDGETYHFTPTQARIVELLWRASEDGAAVPLSYIRQYLLENFDSDCQRVRDLFRRRGRRHPAWGTMIVPGPTKGTLMLAKRPPAIECARARTP